VGNSADQQDGSI